MSGNKRTIFSLDWYVISAQTVRHLGFILLALVVFISAGYGMYLYLKSSTAATTLPGTQSARFIEISGQVRVKKANATDFVTAHEKMPLDAGDTIQTLSSSVARVQFVDGSSYTIKPDTTLIIKDNELMDDKSTKVQVKVRVGTINLATNEQGPGSSNVVQTDVAEAKIGENTEASVGTGESGKQADIRVTRGGAEVHTQAGETYQARTNERLEIEPTGKLMRRSSLLGMPVLKFPDNQQTVRLENADLIRFEWTTVPQANTYAVELATSSTFDKETIVKARDGLRTPTAAFDRLPTGAYYWRVRADKQQEQGVYSDPFKFTLVGSNASGGKISIKDVRKTPMGGATYLVEGHCDVGARVKVAGKLARVAADGNFRAIVTLAPGTRSVLIEAEDKDGNSGRQSLQF
jgi:hypothetical protein